LTITVAFKKKMKHRKKGKSEGGGGSSRRKGWKVFWRTGKEEGEWAAQTRIIPRLEQKRNKGQRINERQGKWKGGAESKIGGYWVPERRRLVGRKASAQRVARDQQEKKQCRILQTSLVGAFEGGNPREKR